MQTEISIRAAQAADSSFILACIHELAEYEKLTHEVVADEDSLREHLFGERRFAEALIGCLDGKPVGYALFFHSYSTFLTRPGIYLEDLYVTEATRGHGVGKALLRALAELAVTRGCGRLEWAVLDWNEPAIRFYQSLGARPVDGWTVYRLAGEALEALGKDR